MIIIQILVPLLNGTHCFKVTAMANENSAILLVKNDVNNRVIFHQNKLPDMAMKVKIRKTFIFWLVG